MVKSTQLKGYKNKIANNLSNLIKTNNWNKFADELQRICGVLTINDFPIEDEFISKIKSNQISIYGDWEIRAYGKAYYVDYTAQQIQEKDVETSCGKTVTVRYVICNEAFDSQVPDAYTDILTKNIDKQISVFISRDELRNIACGDETFNELLSLIQSKIQTATADMLTDTVLCELNKSENYKKLVTLNYCCDRCEGRSLLSVLNTFALKLQRNTAPYNLQERDYNLPVRNMYLIKSYDTDSRIMGILSTTYNQQLVDVQAKFNYVTTVDLTMSDLIIADKDWIQLHEVLNEVDWQYKIQRRGTCGVGNYIARFKMVNFLVAVPVNFAKINCVIKQEAQNLALKIEALTDEITADTLAEAKTAIDALINQQKETDSTLVINSSYDNFVAPTDTTDGSVEVNGVITDAAGNELETFTNTFVLKKN